MKKKIRERERDRQSRILPLFGSCKSRTYIWDLGAGNLFGRLSKEGIGRVL